MRVPFRASALGGAAILVVLALGACSSSVSGTPGSGPPAGTPSAAVSSASGAASTPSQVASSPSAPAPSAGSASAGTPSQQVSEPSAPAESAVSASADVSGSSSSGTPGSGAGLAVADLDYDWTGEPVGGPSTVLPDGEYRCYISNAPADASLTWIGNLAASGADLQLNGNPGSIEYTETTDVHISGAGLDSAQRTVVVQEADGTVALWVRFAEQTARCAP